jgi:hypothetical protein
VPAHVVADHRLNATVALPFPPSPENRISLPDASPKMGIEMSQVASDTFDAQHERYNSIPISGKHAAFPENGNKKAFSRVIKLLGGTSTAPDSGLGTSCRGPCTRHGKEQQVVSCPPRRAPGRLSLRSVRPSVERQDLAGGGIPLPAPSHGKTPASIPAAAPAQWSQPQVRGKAWPPQTQVWGTSRWPQTQVWGDAR